MRQCSLSQVYTYDFAYHFLQSGRQMDMIVMKHGPANVKSVS